MRTLFRVLTLFGGCCLATAAGNSYLKADDKDGCPDEALDTGPCNDRYGNASLLYIDCDQRTTACKGGDPIIELYKNTYVMKKVKGFWLWSDPNKLTAPCYKWAVCDVNPKDGTCYNFTTAVAEQQNRVIKICIYDNPGDPGGPGGDG